MKNFTLLSFILPVLLLIAGCNTPENQIKKDLKSRFTQFEIVEIKEDSSNVYTAINTLRSLELRTSFTNLDIIKTLNKIESSTSKNQIYNYYLYVASIHNELTQSLEKFEKSRFDKPDNCYYVKYLIHKDERKIPKEEYYHLRLMPNGEYDIIHRPYEWDEFLYEKKYDLLIEKALEYSSDIFDLEWKYKKR